MHRTLLAAVLIALATATQAVPQTASQTAAQRRTIPCKVPQNAAMCYWTRGRLNFYLGNPSYRIWKVGTKRILGIYSGPDSERVNPLDGELPEFPANVRRVYDAETDRNAAMERQEPYLIGYVFADFEICPLEPEHAGWMQASCIESAKNIFVEASKRGYR